MSQTQTTVRPCLNCGYDLTALTPGLCPECGVPFEAAPAPKPDTAPDRHPMFEMLVLAAPVVATMASFTLMQFVDKLMVSRISPDPIWITAQSNGGLMVWVPVSCIMGVLTMINTYVSQHLGAGTPQRAPAYAWNGLWIAVAAWTLLIPFGFLLPTIFGWAGHADPPSDPRLIGLESQYGRVLVFGCVLTMATRGIAQFFYGMHRPLVVLVAAIVGNLTNCGLNLVLIFGNGSMPAEFGAFGDAARAIAVALSIPPTGLWGAAVATLVGLAVEFSIPFALFLGPGMNRRLGTRAAWRPSGRHIRDLLRLGWPGGLMFGNEMICWALFTVVLVGVYGPVHSTAGYIALQWMHMSFMPAIGLSVAVTAIVGRCMGMGRPDLAARRTWQGLGVTLAYMGVCAVLFVVLREPMIRLFVPEAMDPGTLRELVRIGGRLMIAAAAFQLFDALGITLNGALRGAGDTVWPGVVTVVLNWGCIVGGGVAMNRWRPDLESLGPWIAASAYIVLVGLAFLARFLGGGWKARRVLAEAAAGR
jgi:MATE family multidrug resistance protein